LTQLKALEEEDEKKVTEKELDQLTELRIRAQEALRSAGSFVVPYLLEALADKQAGTTTRWAAARTLGQLKVKKALPLLVTLLTETTDTGDLETDSENDAHLINLTTEAGKIEFAATRRKVLKNLSEDESRIPAHSVAVRIASAIGLGQIGEQQAVAALETARETHDTLRQQLYTFREHRHYKNLVPQTATDEDQVSTITKKLSEHAREMEQEQEKVLFYINRALSAARGDEA
jgi:HEAT repeat protein